MVFITRQISDYNHSQGNDIKYIVIHATGNDTDTASGNANYFNGGDRGASAHYFVDSNSIYQVVEEYNAAWHCGDGHGCNGITNHNSIGIEMCETNGTIADATINNTLDLVKSLMNKYGISISNVVRHYDASYKCCPEPWSANNWAKWYEFKNRLGQVNEPIITPKTTKLQKQVEAWIYWLNGDYNAKIKVRPNGAYVESELFPNIEAVGKLINLGHKSHLVEFYQQKLQFWGYLKPGDYKVGEYDSITRGAVTELQKKWGRITDGRILTSNNTAQIFLQNE